MKDVETSENQKNIQDISKPPSGILTTHISVKHNIQSISGESSTPFDGTIYIY